MVRWSIRWAHPMTAPPGGAPRVKVAILVPRGTKCPPEILDQKVPGDGWSLCWELVSQKPVRRWSQEARAKVRQRNLRQRMEKKFPLFAEDFIAAEIASRPDYFAGARPV